MKHAPQLSLNKLGEYLSTANPGRRRRILTESKFGTFHGADYRLAQLEMQRLIGHPPYQTQDIGNALWQLAQKYRGATPRQLELSRAALEAFRGNHNVLADLHSIRSMELGSFPTSLTIAGLKISLRPDLVFLQRHPKKGDRMGAIKFWFPKSIHESVEIGEFVATLMHHSLGLVQSAGMAPIAPELCIAFDVHQGVRFHAPKCFQRRMQQVESGCKEIVTLWGTL